METQPIPFEELFRHASGARALAAALVSSPADADDVVQDAWIAAWSRPPAAGTPPRAWLARVVRNIAKNRWRAAERRASREADAARPGSAPGADETAAELETHRALLDAVLALDEPQRTTIVRRYFHGSSAAEIAREEGVPESTVRNRCKRGLETLRARLERRYGSRDAWCTALAAVIRVDSPVSAPPAVLVPFAAWKLAATIVVLGGAAVWMNASAGSAEIDAGSDRSGSQASTTMVVAEDPREIPGGLDESRSGDAGRTRVGAATGAETSVTRSSTAGLLPATLEARIVDEEGRPLPRAVAWVADPATREEDPALVTEATSGADGRVRLVVRSPHRASPWSLGIAFAAEDRERLQRAVEFDAGRTTSLGDVPLRRAGCIVGRVDFGGEPIPEGASVELIAPAIPIEEEGRARRWAPFGGNGPTSILDASGSYRLVALPGSHRVSTRSQLPGWFAAWTEPIRVQAGETVVAPDLVLRPNPNVIGGRILTKDGGPPSDVRLRVGDSSSWDLSWAEVEADGSFLADLATPGTFDLYFRSLGDRGGEILVHGVPTGTRDLDVRLRPLESFELVVLDEDGTPLRDFEWLRTFDEIPGESMGSGTRGSTTGRMRVSAPAMAFRLRVGAADHVPQVVGPFDADDHPDELVLRLQRLRSPQVLVLHEGQPVPGASVTLATIASAQDRLACNGFPTRYGSFDPEVQTDAGGLGTLRPSGPGRFVAIVHAHQLASGESEPFEFDPARPGPEVVVELAKGGSLEGRVLAHDGASPEGILVGVSRGDPWTETCRVGADGRFRFERLAAGTWWVKPCPRDHRADRSYFLAGVPGYDPALVECRVEEGQTTSVELDLRGAFARLVGRFDVPADGGASWAIHLVPTPAGRGMRQSGGSWTGERSVVDPSRGIAAGNVDAGNEFRVDAEVLGPHTLRFARFGTNEVECTIEVPFEVVRGEQRIDVGLPMGTIEGEAAPGVLLEHAWLAGAPWRATSRVRVDGTGRYRAEGVPAGRGTLAVVDSKAAPIEIDVLAGRTSRFDLR